MPRDLRSLPTLALVASLLGAASPDAFGQYPDCLQVDLQCFPDFYPPTGYPNNELLGIEDGQSYTTPLPAGNSSGAIAWDFTGDELPDVLTEINGTARLVVAAGILDMVIDLPLPTGSSYVSSVGYAIDDSGQVVMLGSTDGGTVAWTIDASTGTISVVAQAVTGGGGASDWADATWIKTGDLDGDGDDDDIVAYFEYPAPQGGFLSALRTGTVDGAGSVTTIQALELTTYVAAGCVMDWTPTDAGDEIVLTMGTRFFALDELFGIEAFGFMPHVAKHIAPIADSFGAGAVVLLRESISGGTTDHLQVVRPGANGPTFEALVPLGVTDISAMIVADGVVLANGDLLLAGDDVYALANQSGSGQVSYDGTLLPDYAHLGPVAVGEADDDTRWLLAPDIDDDGDRDPLRAGQDYLATASNSSVVEATRQPLVNADDSIRDYSDVANGGTERTLSVEFRSLSNLQLFGATHVECSLFVEGNDSEYGWGAAPIASASNDSLDVSIVYDYTQTSSSTGYIVARGANIDGSGNVLSRTSAVVFEVLLALELGNSNEGNAPLRPRRRPPIITSGGDAPHKRPTSSQ